MKDWFRVNGTWHAVAEGKKAHCGFEPVEEPAVKVTADDSDCPPTPCRKCLFHWLRDEVIEEPLEVARARGYMPVELDESDDWLTST